LPASCPEFDSWLVPIRSAVGFIGEASCPDDDGAILFTGSISPSHSKDWYQRFLHNDHSASAFAAEVVFNILPACTRSIVFGGVAFGVLERARRENDARGEAAAFVLTIGAMTNGLRSRVGINLESDGATQTRTLQMHVYKSSPGSIEFDVDLVWSTGCEVWLCCPVIYRKSVGSCSPRLPAYMRRRTSWGRSLPNGAFASRVVNIDNRRLSLFITFGVRFLNERLFNGYFVVGIEEDILRQCKERIGL